MSENYRAMSAAELLYGLEYAGRAPAVELIRACIERRTELTAPLLDLLAAPPDKNWHADDPRWYASIHAGHLLIHFREPRAIPIFMRLLRDPENENLMEWFEHPLASYGLAILDEMRDLLTDSSTPERVRIGAPTLLQELAAEFPTERAQVAQILRDALPALDANGKLVIPKPRPEKPNPLWSFIATSLAELHDFKSRPQIEAMYRESWMDESVMGDAKEYLDLLTRVEPLASHPFNIIQTYDGLQRQAELDREWQAKRDEILKQQELIKQRASAQNETTPPPAAATDNAPAPHTPAAHKSTAPASQTIRHTEPKIGRNDPCYCGSGRKYKHCHGK